jgi:UDP-N-acetylmuramyl pentapeptide phosphotransferase/UDP-N-acetylglucosamine-1-phosphate transferase
VPAWSTALLFAAIVTLSAIPLTTGRAFSAGWFERSTQTRRSRRDRRPTHGGLIVAAVVLVVGLVADLNGATTRAVVAVTILAVLAGHRAERGRGPGWAVPAGWVAVALAVPLCGLRTDLTGTAWLDGLFTAVGVLALIAGLDAVDHTDATAPTVAGVAAAGLLAVAIDAHDPVVVLAGALAGACLGVMAHAWPPAAVRVGVIGPMVLGGVLGVVAVAVHPSVGPPRSTLVLVFAFGLLTVLGPLPRLDRRLAAKRLPVHLVLPLAVGAGAFSAAGLSSGAVGMVPAVVVAVVPAAAVLWLGRPRRQEGAPHRPRRARVAVAAAVLAALVGVAGALLLSARHSMERGRVAALAGLDQARAGHLTQAQAQFATADRAFADARSALGNPVVRLGDLLPIVAPNLRAARTLASVGSDLSSTAVAVAQRSGANTLRVVDGHFPVEQARSIGVQLGTALTTLHSAVSRLDGIRSPYLVSQVSHGIDQVRRQVAGVSSSLEVATEATRLLPTLLGADRDQRWIVAVMSTSELRGAGGLLGAFAELRLSGGKVSLVRTIGPTQMNLATDPAQQAVALPPVYAERYGGFHPNELWQNLSVTPNVVTMSKAIASAYPLTKGGGPVDGVLVLDPVALAGLLDLTGPIHVPDWPVPISSGNVEDVLLFQEYDKLPAASLDRFQGEVVTAVVQGLSRGALPEPPLLASTLAPAVQGGHLRLWSADADAERLIHRIGADGEVGLPATGDFVQLVTQNGSQSKIDWYLERSLSYDAVFDPDSGRLQATATVSVTNHAPASGVANYILGTPGGPVDPGQNRIFITILTPHLPTVATDAAGATLPMTLGQEDGLYSATVLLVLDPGAGATVRFSLDGALPPSTSYRLAIGHQATRLPDQVDVALHGSGSWRVKSPAGGAASYRKDGPETFVATLSDG